MMQMRLWIHSRGLFALFVTIMVQNLPRDTVHLSLHQLLNHAREVSVAAF